MTNPAEKQLAREIGRFSLCVGLCCFVIVALCGWYAMARAAAADKPTPTPTPAITADARIAAALERIAAAQEEQARSMRAMCRAQAIDRGRVGDCP